jgi:hypothetical protein
MKKPMLSRSSIARKLINLAVLLILLITGCSGNVSSFQPVVATPTYSEPGKVVAPAKAPLAPLTIWACFYADGCPNANSFRNYFGKDAIFTYGVQVPLTIYYGDEVLFSFEWCAKDRSTLETNKKNMEFVFTIDSVSYAESLGRGSTSMTDPNDPSIVYPCFTVGASLSGWKNGDLHLIGIGAKFLDEIKNGWATSGAGDYIYLFMVNPNDTAPTSSLPKATPTRTRVPGGGGYQPPTDTPAPEHNTPVPPVNTPVPTNTTVVVVPTNTTEPPPTEPPVCDGVVSFTFNSSNNPSHSADFEIFESGSLWDFVYAAEGETVYLTSLCPHVTYDYDTWDMDDYSCEETGTISAGSSFTLNCP